ncbi:MAG: glycosyltransferase [Pseudomonadota bacterium]
MAIYPEAMRVLHVIPNIGPGGPGRSLSVLVGESMSLRGDIEHSVLVLARPVYMPLRLKLKRQGCRLLEAVQPTASAQAIEEADIVLLHFWNTPLLWGWMSRGVPTGRYVLWSKIEGAHAPQHLSAPLVGAVCATVFTALPPPHLVGTAPASVVPGLVELERVRGVEPKTHDRFSADYLGTMTSGKLHPLFFQMMDRVAVPELKVRLCGGALERGFEVALSAAQHSERFEQLGFVEDIASVLATSDVLAYPLSPTTYASSDKSLQEAMLAGVPPVILPHGGPARFVEDGETGIVAKDEDAFVEAIERLHREPQLRVRLGKAAQRYALGAFAPRPHVERLMEVLDKALSTEKRPLFDERVSGGLHAPAGQFLVSQGWSVAGAQDAVERFLSGTDLGLIDYAAAAGDDVFRLEGGILQWRNSHPEDPILRCWAGFWLCRQGDRDAASAEFTAAAAFGAPAACITAAQERATVTP